MDTAYQLQKEANKAERKAQRAAEKAEREPEESDQKAKKVRKAEKAKAKAEEARSKLKAERAAVSHLRWHGNRVGMPRIDFLHDKPEVGRICGISVWLLGRPDRRRKKTRRRLKESSRMSQVIKRRSQNRSVRVTDCRLRGRFQSWDRICEVSQKQEGEGFVYFCGSQGCRKTFKDKFAYLQHLWSKCDTPGHPSKEIAKRWSADKPFVAVSGDPNHPDPQLVVKQQKELKDKMKKEIQDYEDKKARSFCKLKGKRRSPRVPSLNQQIQQMRTRSARQPRRLELL